jgi:ATP-dependent protease HslVU (ClpYQ) ATPase subunit
MDQAQLLSIIGSVYDKFVADVSAKVESRLLDTIVDRLNTSGMLTTEIDTRIQAKIDDLTGLDKAMITEIVKGEIEDLDIDQSISDWMSNNFDISEYEHNLDIEDKISDYLSDHLTDRVRDEVRDLSFSVTVD